MLNPATQPLPDWNEFTEYLRDHPGTMVRLRSGVYVQPLFEKAEDESCSDGFVYENFRWYTTGKSLTSRDFDMMSLITEKVPS